MGTRVRLVVRSPWVNVFVALGSLLASEAARATCDVIPNVPLQRYRGAIGSVSRPYASPGEWIDLQGSGCGGSFEDTDTAPPDGVHDEYGALLIFEPRGGTPSAVFIAPSCTGVDLSACASAGATTQCLDASSVKALGTKGPQNNPQLEVMLPGTCKAGDPRSCLRDADCTPPTSGSCQFDPQEQPRALTGPLTIAATRTDRTPACDLVGKKKLCKAIADPTKVGACIDRLYSTDTPGHCGTHRRDIEVVFPGFTALPPVNDFSLLCDQANAAGCTLDTTSGTNPALRVAIDQRGNALVPIWWEKVLFAPNLGRFLTGSTSFRAKSTAPGPIRVADRGSVISFTRDGLRLPSLFQAYTDTAAQNELSLYGTAEAKYSVLRIPSRKEGRRGGRICSGGPDAGKECTPGSCTSPGICRTLRCRDNPGTGCAGDPDCPDDDECGVPGTDLSDRMADGGVATIAVERLAASEGVCEDTGVPCTGSCAGQAKCVQLRARARWPVPLNHTIATPTFVVVTLDETMVGSDLDGDGQAVSPMVAVVYDAQTSAILTIGEGGVPNRGRAVVAREVKVGSETFRFPVVAASQNFLTLVEACKNTSFCPGSTGPRLRAYERVGSTMEERTSAAIEPVVEAVIDGEPIAVTPKGRVLYRAKRSADPTRTSLFVLDAASPTPPAREVCPAVTASVSEERIVFLRPESAGKCDEVTGAEALNGDGTNDRDDDVVFALDLDTGSLRNLNIAATQISLGAGRIAAAVSEAHEGGANLNPTDPPDSDATDDVIHVRRFGGAAGWKNLGRAVRKPTTTDPRPTIAVAGENVAFIRDDGEMHVALPSSYTPTPLGEPAFEFELGDPTAKCESTPRPLLAYRTTSSATQVVRTYDLATSQPLAEIGPGVRVCDEMACDPRHPYVVDQTLVRVLAPCPEDAAKDCIHVYDACRHDPAHLFAFDSSWSSELKTSAEGLVSSERVGRCVQDLGKDCRSNEGCSAGSSCLASRAADRPRFTCHADSGWCRSDDDCPSAAPCRLEKEGIGPRAFLLR